jgi:large subunit ribosomal protein L13
MATAIAASAFLSSAFARDRPLPRQRRAARPATRRAAAGGLSVRCEQSEKQKRQPLSALVPREQRFMFEGDELCGPVLTLTSLSLSRIHSSLSQFRK